MRAYPATNIWRVFPCPDVMVSVNDILNDIHDGAVAVHYNSYSLVAERQRSRRTDDGEGLVAQILYIDNLQTRLCKAFRELMTAGIYRDTVFSHYHIDCRTRCDQRQTSSTTHGIRPRNNGQTMIESALSAAVSG